MISHISVSTNNPNTSIHFQFENITIHHKIIKPTKSNPNFHKKPHSSHLNNSKHNNHRSSKKKLDSPSAPNPTRFSSKTSHFPQRKTLPHYKTFKKSRSRINTINCRLVCGSIERRRVISSSYDSFKWRSQGPSH